MKSGLNWMLAGVLVLGAWSCDKPTPSLDVDYLPPGSVIDAYDDVPGLVKLTIYDADGKVAAEGDYLNGQKHGPWTEYHPERKTVSLLETYYQGQKQGIALIFDDNGNLSSKAYYSKGKLNGVYQVFNARRVTEEHGYEDGLKQGPTRKYYKTGTLMEDSNYLNGQLHGICTWFDIDGNISIQYRYDNGVLAEEIPLQEAEYPVEG